MLEEEIINAVPAIDPPACHWLDSDAGPSYCRKHAWEARWKELPSFGPCPEEPFWFRRSDLEELMADGIDGCANMGSESDTSEICETCGCTLEYLLTEYGQAEELAHYDEHPVEPGEVITGEQTYALSRIFMNLDHPTAKPEILTAAIKLAEATISAIRTGLHESN